MRWLRNLGILPLRQYAGLSGDEQGYSTKQVLNQLPPIAVLAVGDDNALKALAANSLPPPRFTSGPHLLLAGKKVEDLKWLLPIRSVFDALGANVVCGLFVDDKVAVSKEDLARVTKEHLFLCEVADEDPENETADARAGVVRAFGYAAMWQPWPKDAKEGGFSREDLRKYIDVDEVAVVPAEIFLKMLNTDGVTVFGDTNIIADLDKPVLFFFEVKYQLTTVEEALKKPSNQLKRAEDESQQWLDLGVANVVKGLFVNGGKSKFRSQLPTSPVREQIRAANALLVHVPGPDVDDVDRLEKAEDALAAAKADNEKKDGEIEARDTILAAKDETIKELGTDLAAEKVKLQNVAKLAAATKDPGLRKQLEDILRAGTRNDAG